jgi:hypothetical protein
MMPYEILLIKLLPSHRVNDFLDGNLYMNTVDYFASLEKSDAVRADDDEGVDESLQVKEVAIANENGEYIPIGGIINPILYRSHDPKDLNIFCMYALPNTLGHRLDERNLGFGEIGVVLTNAKEFVERFRKAAIASGRQPGHGLIEYVDKFTYHGPMGPFRKFDKFSYQCEFRLMVDGGDATPLVLSIGDIRDICLVGSSLALNKMIALIESGEQKAFSN